MNGEWTAASVRAGALARQRLGAGGCRTLAAQPDLSSAIDVLAPTVYGRFVAGAPSLAAAAHGTRAMLLWQLRVLAGWFPPSGGRLARALAGGFERDNIVGLVDRLFGRPAPPVFELGALATVWPRLREASSPAALERLLSWTVWASPRGGLSLRDRLSIAWLRRLDAAIPAVRPWCTGALVGLIAKSRLLEGAAPPPALREEATRLVGSRWESARSLAELREALPLGPRRFLDDVESPEDIWRAEAALRRRIEDDAFAWARSARPGPEAVVGSLALLASDAWRVRSALASAAGLGTGASHAVA